MKAGRCGLTSDELHDSAERVAAVEIRGAAAKHFHIGERRARNAVPVDPAPEGIDQRKSIFEHQRAAGGGSAQASQRYTLIRGVSGAAIGSTKERESGNLSQHVIDAQRGSGGHIGVGKQNCAAWSFGKAHLRTRRGNGDLFARRSRLQNNFEIDGGCRSGVPRLANGVESLAADLHGS